MRARLDVLSEIPREWQRVLRRWQRLNRTAEVARRRRARPRRQRGVPDLPDPDRRLADGRRSTPSWTDAARDDAARPHQRLHDQGAARGQAAHQLDQRQRALRDGAVAQFVDPLLEPAQRRHPSWPSCAASWRGIVMPGLYNSLSQVVLKITAPGVPDFYQGTELWDLSLVDPDNRRPVDYAARRALLAELAERGDAELPALCAELLAAPADGALKLLVTARALRHRRRHRALFERGDYVPLAGDGARRRHVVAFARTTGRTASHHAGRAAVRWRSTPRRRRPLARTDWGDTRVVLPPTCRRAHYRDALTGSVSRRYERSATRLDIPSVRMRCQLTGRDSWPANPARALRSLRARKCTGADHPCAEKLARTRARRICRMHRKSGHDGATRGKKGTFAMSPRSWV